MNHATLINLRNYIYGALTPSDIRWLGTELMAYTTKETLPPYTMQEINTMIDESEKQSARGELHDSKDVFNRLETRFCEVV